MREYRAEIPIFLFNIVIKSNALSCVKEKGCEIIDYND